MNLSFARTPAAPGLLMIPLLAACASPPDDGDSTATTTRGTKVVSAEGEELGVVDFPTSCPAIQVELEQGLALLHHMNYTRARAVFGDAAATDPECALAHWGIAMSYVHPLWPDTISPIAAIGAPNP